MARVPGVGKAKELGEAVPYLAGKSLHPPWHLSTERAYFHLHLIVPKQQNGPSALSVPRGRVYVQISHIDRSCSKAWASERAAEVWTEEVVGNAFVGVVDA